MGLGNMSIFKTALNTGNGESIPIQVTRDEDETIFMECSEASAFLQYLTQSEFSPENLGTSLTVCGTVVPGSGAVFDIRDNIGTLIDEYLTLDHKQVDELLLKPMQLPFRTT